MSKEKKGFFAEFREFIMRGNVLDMAIGVVIATAFGKITNALVNNIIMPIIGMLIGDIDLSKWDITISDAVMAADGVTVEKEAVVIGIGALLVTIIDFIIIAFAIFVFIKIFNKAKEISEAKLFKKNQEEEAAEEAPPAPTTEELLADILAELKAQNKE